MIPCRTNVSGSHPGTAHLNFDWLVMFHSWRTMQKTLSFSEPCELESSLNFSLSIQIQCVAWKDLRLGMMRTNVRGILTHLFCLLG